MRIILRGRAMVDSPRSERGDPGSSPGPAALRRFCSSVPSALILATKSLSSVERNAK